MIAVYSSPRNGAKIPAKTVDVLDQIPELKSTKSFATVFCNISHHAWARSYPLRSGIAIYFSYQRKDLFDLVFMLLQFTYTSICRENACQANQIVTHTKHIKRSPTMHMSNNI